MAGSIAPQPTTPSLQKEPSMAKRAKTSATELLTVTERRLLESSLGKSLATASAAQLGKAIELARSFRDKWRDTFRAQRRTGQAAAGARGVGGNDRSDEKSEIFAGMLARLEARLAEIGSSVPKAVASKREASKRPSKKIRTAAVRTERASVKAALAEHVTASPGTRKPVKKKAVARKAVVAKSVAQKTAGGKKPRG